MKANPTGNPGSAYHAYLLKIWLEHAREIAERAWRFSLEDAYNGTRLGFTHLESLLIYLQDITTLHSEATE